jgi:nicotinamide riboside transporter PnuC
MRAGRENARSVRPLRTLIWGFRVVLAVWFLIEAWLWSHFESVVELLQMTWVRRVYGYFIWPLAKAHQKVDPITRGLRKWRHALWHFHSGHLARRLAAGLPLQASRGGIMRF